MNTSQESKSKQILSEHAHQQRRKNQRSVCYSSNKAKKCWSSREFLHSVTNVKQRLNLNLVLFSKVSSCYLESHNKAVKETHIPTGDRICQKQCNQIQTLSFSAMKIQYSTAHHKMSINWQEQSVHIELTTGRITKTFKKISP